jgi:hypothetical protein
VLVVSVVRFSRSADRDDAGRSAAGWLPPERMLEEKAPTEKTPVVKASSRRAAGRSDLGGRAVVCGRAAAEEEEVLMK